MKRRIQTCGRITAFTVLTALLSTAAFEGSALAQGGPPKDQEEGFAVAPIPMVQPVTQEGGGLALLYKYYVDSKHKNSSSSATAIGGFITGNRSWGAGLAQRFYFMDDRWRARMAGTYVDIHYNYYGIGTAAGESGISVRMTQKGPGALGELMYRFGGLWYGGAYYRFTDTTSTFRPNPQFDSASISPGELDLRTASLGPRVTRDSRDDTDYPRDGSLLDAHAGFHGNAVGGQLKYETYDLSFSKYLRLGSSQVLAIRGAGCYVTGNVPFFEECLLTASENLRGYQASRYRDSSMLASQAEYRLEVGKRFGFVAFGGAGEVGPTFSDFNTDNVLPGGGVGARYRFTRESHVNLRFDYAWGKDSHQAYFFIGEAF